MRERVDSGDVERVERARRAGVRDFFIALAAEVVLVALATEIFGGSSLQQLFGGSTSRAIVGAVQPFGLAALVGMLSFTLRGGWTWRYVARMAKFLPVGVIAGALATFLAVRTGTPWRGSAADWAAAVAQIIGYTLLTWVLALTRP